MTTYYPSRVVLRDPALPHQIVIAMVQGGPLIYVSCNCRRSPAGGHMPIESRVKWEAGEILAAYRAHLPASDGPAAERETAAGPRTPLGQGDGPGGG